MLEIIKSVIFGIVEGVTEWLPISSTGHLLLLDQVLKLQVTDAFKDQFMVIIQLGAVLSVIVLFFHELNPFTSKKNGEGKKATWMLWAKVVVATIPAGILGFLLDDFMDLYLNKWQIIVAALFVYGLAYVLVEKKEDSLTPRIEDEMDLSFKDAFYIGCFQALAIIPGTSRSGSTILGGILLGISRTAAARFSFFMAIPVMFGASLLRLVKHGVSFSGNEGAILAVGTLVSFVVSLLVIRKLMDYVKSHSFAVFGWYRMGLSIVVTIVFLLFV